MQRPRLRDVQSLILQCPKQVAERARSPVGQAQGREPPFAAHGGNGKEHDGHVANSHSANHHLRVRICAVRIVMRGARLELALTPMTLEWTGAP